MAQKRRINQSKLIADAALDLADKAGWDGFSLKDVARKARLKEAVVARVFPDTWAILLYVLKDLDGRTAKAADTDKGAAWHDNLFEILMARADLMNDHRDAFVSVLPSLLRHPQAGPKFLKPFHDSMRGMLDRAGAPATPLHVAAFGAVYLAVIETWRQDESADLSKTMAAADKYLGMFEKYLNCAPLRKQGPSSPHQRRI